MRLTLLSLILLTFVLTCTEVSAQYGTIQGVVRDSKTGEALRRATVFVTVQGKMNGGFSDAKGQYLLKSIPEGEYELHCRFIGYQEKRISGVKVMPSKATTIDITLAPLTTTTKDVVVQARAARESEAAVLTQRKNASEVQDGVSATEIKQQSDKDAAQVLKRVSGVTIVGDKYVYVRGINERYNSTTLNGTSLASSENDKKAFSFDMFPSEFLQSASVVKTFSADLPGNFAGGLVQLQTVDFPEGYSLRFNASGSASDNLSLRTNGFAQNTGGPLDWLGFDDGTRAMPSSLPATRAEMNTLLAQARAFYAGDKSEQNTAAAKRWQDLAGDFNNSLWQRQERTPLPVGSFGLAYSNVKQVGETQLGLISSLNYGNGLSRNQLQRQGISSTGENLFNYAGTNWSKNTSISALLNLAAKLNEHSTISIRNVYNHMADEDLVELQGVNVAQTRDLRLQSNDYNERGLFSTQLIGEHSIGEEQSLLVDWRAGYSLSNKSQPDFRRLRFSRSAGTEENFVVDIPYPGSQSGDGTSAGHFMSSLNDHVWTAGANAKLSLSPVSLKVGAMMERRDRQFDTRSFTYIQSKIFSKGEVVADSVLMQDASGIFQDSNFGADGIAISEDSKSSDSYTANENLQAAYGLIDVPFQLGSENLRLIAGVRIEDNRTQLRSVYSYKSGTTEPDSLVNTDLHTTDVLPALNFVWKVQESMNLRMAASQTLTRPSLREYAPFAYYDFQNLALIQGNPKLTRAQIQNADLRWEFFPRAAEVLSAGLFYKRFIHAIEETIVPAASEIQRTYSNADAPAINYGFELECRKSLSILSSALDHFLINLNYTWIHSEIEIKQGLVTDTRPLWGQSPYSFNASLFYVHPDNGLSASLAYNVSGKRIVQVAQIGSFSFSDPHVYEMPCPQLDFSCSYQLSDALHCKLAVRDLLNQALVWNQGGQTVSSIQRGRTVGLSMSYTLK